MTGVVTGPAPADDTAPSEPLLVVCAGCWRLKPARRWACMACEHRLPASHRRALASTAGQPITDHARAVALAEAYTWLRVRREGRHP